MQNRTRDALLWAMIFLGFAGLAVALGLRLQGEAALAALAAGSWCGDAPLHEGQFVLLGHCARCAPLIAAYVLAWSGAAWAALHALGRPYCAESMRRRRR